MEIPERKINQESQLSRRVQKGIDLYSRRERELEKQVADWERTIAGDKSRNIDISGQEEELKFLKQELARTQREKAQYIENNQK